MIHRRRLLALGLLTVVVAALTYPGAMLISYSIHLRPSSSGSGGDPALPWLHVAHRADDRPFIADPEGRKVILHGVVTGSLVDYWSGTSTSTLAPPPFHSIDPMDYEDGRCPAISATISQPALCEQDLAQMRALGLDVLRLALSWSLLEPLPGRYDKQYLDRIAQVVGWARSRGIYVILDMHENAYSRYMPRPDPPPLPGGAPTTLSQLSGAPVWAVMTDSLPSEVYGGQRELNPAVNAAFTNFWLNRWVDGAVGESPGRGLQDHYIGAVAALARRFANDSTVAGYSPFNEPWPGFIAPPLFEDLFLFPFYRRVIDALTGARDGLPCPASSPALAVCGYPDLGIHDRRHLFFLEPDHLRSQTDFATHLPGPVSSYGNLVYSIHAYTHVFTLDALAGQDPAHATYPPGGFDTSYRSAVAEAKALRAALFVSEFGSEPQSEGLILATQLREQEKYQVGSTFWVWKELCSYTSSWGVYEGLYEGQPNQRCAVDHGQEINKVASVQNLCLRLSRERLLARVRPRAAGGRLISYSYDPVDGGFTLQAVAPAGTSETVVDIPRQVRGQASVQGAAAIRQIETRADGSRTLRVAPMGGTYKIAVASAPLALSSCNR